METNFLPEEELITYLKPILKAKGFKKKGKRWTKSIEEFTLSFLIQTSAYYNKDYYIRPGVFITRFMDRMPWHYGHVWLEIPITTPEQILSEFEAFCEKWTDKAFFKAKLQAFIDWDKRFPLEKRRQLMDEYFSLHGAYPTAEQRDELYHGDLCPAEEFFYLTNNPSRNEIFAYVLENFG